MSSDQDNKEFRSVNTMLGSSPSFGPVPADQVFPWAAIAMFSYLICFNLLQLGYLWTGIIGTWGMATWWILTGQHGWRFLSKFMPVPTWTRGYTRYLSFVEADTPRRHEAKSRKTKGKSQRQASAPRR